MSLPTYNCLIVDDEPPAREVLKRYITKLPMLNLIGECSNALQVIAFLHANPVDIMFLDIRMPQLNGLELVSSLVGRPKIIFTTAYSEYALESYDLEATDYLLKPIKFERFVKAVNRALPNYQPPPVTKADISTLAKENFLYFRADRKMVKVVLKEILYVESLKDYVKIVIPDGQVITKYSMAAMEAMLPAGMFLRVHRSYIIAINQVISFNKTHIQLGRLEIPIGKIYQIAVFKKLSMP
ncbi:LytR/AlgR family response regulator transcription factor [Mucilaginibacter aquaedulcis]|uniref:LytR/AlgR family response regulator transcription factor n=1 Tax=Mucilaginibacter aquaedulcis TaxID=1187081 RepID=UPI0025B613BC|nr:LytTR family DNA-binding domain-containing protein [Mucilaginibacter aquaedulcis]MDN3551251.1 LytTR family DNA-binding domain-containing protein [Mucilaginibacter aquaedulcis]